MKVSKYISDFLIKQDIDTVFGYTGGNVAGIIDSILLEGSLDFVVNYHEQASSFCANSFAQISQKTGVALASSGPGACNLINGIANAFYDSIPCIYITGNVHTLVMRNSNKIRQNGFQETDIVSLVSEITKYAVKIEDSKDIRYELEKAFHIANEGRKGPVLIDIPYNIARENIELETLKGFQPEVTKYDDINIDDAIKLLKDSKKPIILLGGGSRGINSEKHLKTLLEKVKIPAVASLCGIDTLPHNNDCYVGFIGHYGNRYANLALANADCIFILGSRLDERQLGGYRSKFAPNAKVLRVDIDKMELERKVAEDISIYYSVENFLEKLSSQNFDGMDFSIWRSVIEVWKNRYPSFDFEKEELAANNFLHTISDYLPSDTIICADVGQNQMCAAQTLRLDDERRLLNSAGYGSMGYSLPAAIGASYAKKGACIVSINGDGGIQMNIQELQTIVRENLPINIIILNNNCLGMIRRLQENMFDNRTYASVEGYNVPDFSAIAKAYNIPYLLVSSLGEYSQVKDFISNLHPTITEVCLPTKMTNYPEPGESLEKQIPLLSDEEFTQIKKECEF